MSNIIDNWNLIHDNVKDNLHNVKLSSQKYWRIKSEDRHSNGMIYTSSWLYNGTFVLFSYDNRWRQQSILSNGKYVGLKKLNFSRLSNLLIQRDDGLFLTMDIVTEWSMTILESTIDEFTLLSMSIYSTVACYVRD